LVVPISGGLGAPEWEVQGTDLTRRMAQSLGAGLRYLPAPGVVANPLVRQALMEDPQVGDTLATAARADVVVLGIGVPRIGSVVARSGILTDEETQQFMQQGAVGDIALRFFDRDGRPMAHQVGERTIGLTLEQIRRIPRRIGVAGGEGKFEVIRGALRGRLINVLITDDRTASALLEDAEPATRPRVADQSMERQGNHVALPIGA
jgi:DNA-binding transcriptional regulator LsrR (DeoR family)